MKTKKLLSKGVVKGGVVNAAGTAARAAVAAGALMVAANGWAYTIDANAIGETHKLRQWTSLLLGCGSSTGRAEVADSRDAVSDIDTGCQSKAQAASRRALKRDDDIAGIGDFLALPIPLIRDYLVTDAKFWALFQPQAGYQGPLWALRSLPKKADPSAGGSGEPAIQVGGSTASVPEPGSVSLIAAGLLGLFATRRFCQKA